MTSVPSERVPLSPYDRIKRIRRCASAIEQGVPIKDLVRRRGFSSTEVDAAREMLQEKAIRMKKLRDDVLLEKVTLPRATRTFLQRAGFKTVGDVRRASADSLVAVRGLGRQSYTAIHKVIGIPEMAKRWRLEEESG